MDIKVLMIFFILKKYLNDIYNYKNLKNIDFKK
jgi:hypothetical protein